VESPRRQETHKAGSEHRPNPLIPSESVVTRAEIGRSYLFFSLLLERRRWGVCVAPCDAKTNLDVSFGYLHGQLWSSCLDADSFVVSP
jgi:hypothetical protein